VALDHPGRDRERGRIWRIVYTGKGTTRDAQPLFDISRASLAELISELANPNITRRMLAMNQLVDRIGAPAVSPTTTMLQQKDSTAFQRIHGLWVLQRLNALDDRLLASAGRDEDPGVRVHSLRVCSEIPEWSSIQEQLALTGLRDANPYVQRAAADALGRHPAFSHIRPLLDLRQTARTEDAQLVHVTRMALRNQLLSEENLRRLQTSQLKENDSRALADVAVAVDSAAAGQFLLKHALKFSESREKLATYLRHASRFAPESDLGELVRFARKTFSEDIDLQIVLFRSIQEGTSQRGGKLDPAVREWGTQLAEQLFASVRSASLEWRNSPTDKGETPNPWCSKSANRLMVIRLLNLFRA